jgi:hypothetical protein
LVLEASGGGLPEMRKRELRCLPIPTDGGNFTEMWKRDSYRLALAASNGLPKTGKHKSRRLVLTSGGGSLPETRKREACYLPFPADSSDFPRMWYRLILAVSGGLREKGTYKSCCLVLAADDRCLPEMRSCKLRWWPFLAGGGIFPQMWKLVSYGLVLPASGQWWPSRDGEIQVTLIGPHGQRREPPQDKEA